MGSNSGASIVSRLRTLAVAGFALVASSGMAAAQDQGFVDLPHYGQMNLPSGHRDHGQAGRPA
jgi:hypothetical protein